jgi:hypothetical protein
MLSGKTDGITVFLSLNLDLGSSDSHHTPRIKGMPGEVRND